MTDRITKTWELALECGHTVRVVPHPEGAKVTGMGAGCPVCAGILDAAPEHDDGGS